MNKIEHLGIDQDSHIFKGLDILSLEYGNCMKSSYDGLLINAGAYTHTSIAIFDALKAIKIPIVEIHLSNIHKREEFRKKSYISEVADGVIFGFGSYSYILAVMAMKNLLK